MDKNTKWFCRLAEEICNGKLTAIPYVGRGDSSGAGRFYNPPAEHMEITFVAAGSIRNVDIGGRKVDFQAGRVHLHNVHFGNYSQPYTDCQNWCLVLDVKGRKKFLPMKRKPFFTSFPVYRLERLTDSFSELMFSCNQQNTLSTAYFGGPVLFDPSRAQDNLIERRLKVSAAIFRFFEVLIAELNSDSYENLLPDKLSQAQNFIALNFQRHEISLEDIAANSGVSTNHLGLLFRQYLNTTPMRYLKSYRLNHARNLLLRTGLHVGEIAQRVGFADQLHFSREYRKHFGFQPTKNRCHADSLKK